MNEEMKNEKEKTENKEIEERWRRVWERETERLNQRIIECPTRLEEFEKRVKEEFNIQGFLLVGIIIALIVLFSWVSDLRETAKKFKNDYQDLILKTAEALTKATPKDKQDELTEFEDLEIMIKNLKEGEE
jgi:hypothetical protein